MPLRVSFASIGRPSTSQTASAASIRPGRMRTGRDPTRPNAAVSPGAIAMPCASTRPARASVWTLRSFVPLPVPPITTMASASARPRAVARSSRVASARLNKLRAIGDERARDHRRCGVEHGVGGCAGAHEVNARRADRHALDPGRRQHREIDGAQPRAGLEQDGAGADIALRRQHAFAGRDLSLNLVPAILLDHGIGQCHRVGSGRQRVAGIDTMRRAGSSTGA